MASEERYRNWIDLSLCLLKTREGIKDFVQQQANDLHLQIKIRVCTKSTSAATTPCNSCKYTDIKKTKPKKNSPAHWRINCPNGICNLWLDEILAHHCHGPGAHIAWRNTNPKLWQRRPWEVMKIFQPRGCERNASADDADITSLLTLMIDCTHFHRQVTNVQILQEVKDIRNITMHSTNYQVSRSDVRRHGNKMITLLQDPLHLHSLGPCQVAVQNIKELIEEESWDFTFRWGNSDFFHIERGSMTVRLTARRVIISLLILIVAGLTLWNWGAIAALIATLL